MGDHCIKVNNLRGPSHKKQVTNKIATFWVNSAWRFSNLWDFLRFFLFFLSYPRSHQVRKSIFNCFSSYSFWVRTWGLFHFIQIESAYNATEDFLFKHDLRHFSDIYIVQISFKNHILLNFLHFSTRYEIWKKKHFYNLPVIQFQKKKK